MLPFLIGMLGGVSGTFLGALMGVAMLTGAIPYAAFAICTWYWSLGRSDRTLMLSSLLMPVASLPFFLVMLLFPSDWELLRLARVVLLTGYAFVGASWVLWGLVLIFKNLRSRANR